MSVYLCGCVCLVVKAGVPVYSPCLCACVYVCGARVAVSELAAECSTLRTQVQQLEVTKARLTTQLEQEQESHATTRDKLSNASGTAGCQQSVGTIAC